jgi:hypothetical protein
MKSPTNDNSGVAPISRPRTSQRSVRSTLTRTLRLLLPALIIATIAAPLVDPGVASAAISTFAFPTQAPNPVAVGATVTYTGIVVSDSNTAATDYVKLTAGTLPSGTTNFAVSTNCLHEPGGATNTVSFNVTMTAGSTSGTFTVAAQRFNDSACTQAHDASPTTSTNSGTLTVATPPTSVTFSGAPQTAGSSATWTEGFTSTSTGALAAGSTIKATFNSAFTVPANPTITLPTGFNHCSATATSAAGVVTVTLANSGGTCALAASSGATFTIAGITNPAANTYAANTFSVSTSANNAPANPATAVIITSPATQPTSVSFSGSPQTSGSSATWTEGFTSSSAGALASGSTITATFNSAFTVPANPTITRPTGFNHCSATATALTGVVTITLANSGGTCALAATSAATFTIAGITNPAANTYAANTFSVSTSKDTSAANPSSAVVLTATPTNVVTNSSPTTLGSPVTFTDTITGPTGGATPTGSITWTLSGPGSPTCANSNLSGAANTATTTCSITPTVTGTYTATAAFSATTIYNSVTSSQDSITVAAFAPTNVVTNSSPTTLGSTVTYTDTVTGPTNGPTPTGTIAWTLSGPNSPTCSSVLLAGSGHTATATCVITYSQSGTYTASAAYPGDSNYNSVTSATNSNTVANPTPTNVVSVSPASPTLGSTVTYTDTVTGPTNGPTPTGTVAWTLTGPNTPSCSASTLSGSGNTAHATCVVVYSDAAVFPTSYTARAAYPGDSNYNSVNSNTTTNYVAKVTPTNVITNSTPTLGSTITFTDTISGPTGGAAPSGNITWTLTGPTTPTCVATSLTGSTNVTTATCTVSASKAGTYTARAAYPGDSNYNSITSAIDTAVVAPATPTNVVTDSAPSVLGSTVVYTATVTGPSGAPTPTGTITWTVTGPNSPSCASSVLSGSGNTATATCTLVATRAGSYTAKASLPASANYNAVVSAVDTVVIDKVTPDLVVTNNNPTPGSDLTYTATVTGPIGAPTPTGSLDWSVNAASGTWPCTSNTGPTGSSNVVTYSCTVSGVYADSYSATVTYPGDSNYTAANLTDNNPTVDQMTITQGPSTVGTTDVANSANFTDTLSANGGFSGPVAFVTSDSSPELNVGAFGDITTTGTVPAGIYTIDGINADAYGDYGTWSYTFTVYANSIVQGPNSSGSTDVGGSSSYTDTLSATTGYVGALLYTQTSPTTNLSVNSSGQLTTSGVLSAGTYTVSGGVVDGYGDTGTWAYTLTVNPGQIVQGRPTSGLTDVAGSANFTDTLSAASNFVGPVTFTQTSSTDSISVAGDGKLTTSGFLVGSSAGTTYTATGTDADAYGDTGTFTYSLTVYANTITQSSNTTGTTDVAGSSAFTDTLAPATGFVGPVTFTQTSPTTNLNVSADGSLTTTGALAAGSYTVVGTTADGFGDTGTFTYTLTVNPDTIGQGPNTAGTADVVGSAAFTDTLSASSNFVGPVTFIQTSPTTGLNVSSSGGLTTSGPLPGSLAGLTYTVSGTTADGYGDTGTFTYTLTVTTETIVQGANNTGTTDVAGSASFNDTLTPASGFVGFVAFTQTSSNAHLSVDFSGNLTTAGHLPAGPYTVSGTTADGYGDTGTFTYTLTVNPDTIVQSPNTAGTTDVVGSSTFTDTLAPASGFVGSVTFTQTSPTTNLNVDSSGALTTTGHLAAGPYTVSGTTSDTFGDSGTFTYTLTVNADTIAQDTNTAGSTDVVGSAAFTDTLAAASGFVGPVTFTQTSPATSLSVGTDGSLTTSGPLAADPYTVAGTTADGYGDTGVWTYTLTVTANTIIQSSNITGSVDVVGSSAFTDTLAPASGFVGVVTFTQTSPTTQLSVGTDGSLATTGSLAAGPYTATGTTSDTFGDTGSFTYTLTVSAGTIVQAQPKSGHTGQAGSASFTDTLAASAGFVGPVTFTQTNPATHLLVSTSGHLTTTGTQAAGSYTVSGTTSDAFGDTGTFTYTLTVNPVVVSGAQGYRIVGTDGGIFSFNAPFYGSAGNITLNKPIVGMAATPDGKGYWLVASDGGIFSFGDASFHGSTGSITLNKPIVGMAATPDGKGYWLVASDGGIFSFGDAQFFGSAGNIALNKPIVGMAATPNGKGYWFVASDGGIFAYGDAPFYGSAGNISLSKPIVGMAATPDGKGYWFVAADGGIFNYGDASYKGSVPGLGAHVNNIVGLSANPVAQ